PGFNPSRIVAANFYLPVPNNPDLDRYSSNPEILNSFAREVVRRVNAIPGVDLASMTTDLPVTHLSWRPRVNIEDRPDESGAGLAGIGVGIGLILSGMMAPLISSLLYGVRPLDPEVFVAVPVILMVVVLLASYIPALRAARVNPIVALRRES